jgi:hypothetical protein
MLRVLKLLLGCTVVVVLTATVHAMMIAPMPVPGRVASSEIVVVGKVTAIENKTVMARQFSGAPDKVEYKIAVIQVSDLLKGPKGLTTVRVGFVPPAPPPPPPKPGQPFILRKQYPQVNFAVGQEGCCLLKKHFEGDFLTAVNYYDVIDKKTPNFDKDVALIKRCTKLLEDPNGNLKSKSAEDRLLTASLLVTQYRGGFGLLVGGGQKQKTEPIEAEQSKLILEALVSADWSQRETFSQVSPQMVIGQLNLTAQDGWNPPQFKDYQKEFPPYAQKWLKDNTGKYRIQRFVP